MTKEALKLALETLDVVKLHFTQNRHVNEAITAIKEALAQPDERPWVGLDYDELIERANQEECASVFSRGAIWGAARLREKNA
jgi:hypothetical protein